MAPEKKLTASILCSFFGFFGIHRFYVGKYGTGFLQLITLGFFGIWAWIDLMYILCNEFTNSKGQKLTS